MKMTYDPESDVLAMQVVKKGKLHDTLHSNDTIVHVDKKGQILYIEFLNASHLIPRLVETAISARQVA